MDQTVIPMGELLASRAELLALIAAAKAQHRAALAETIGLLRQTEEYINANLGQLGLDKVMERRFELVETAALAAGPAKDEQEVLAASIVAAERFIQDHMNQTNAQQVKYAAGMAFFTSNAHVGVADWDLVLDSVVDVVTPMEGVPEEQWAAMIDHLREHGNWQILKKDVAKTPIKEIVEATGAPPAGVKWEPYRSIQFRKK